VPDKAEAQLGAQTGLARAASLYIARRFKEAEEACAELLGAGVRNFDVLHLSGLSLLQQGKPFAAAERFADAVALNPTDRDAHNNLGVALLGAGRAAEAASRFRAALELDPNFFEAHVNLGNAFNALGSYAEAAATYRRALEARSDVAELYNNLGTALHSDGQLEEAVRNYRAGIELRPNDAGAALNLAKALKALGRIEEAIEAYRILIAHSPDQPQALREFGETLLEAGRLTEAESCFRNLVALESAAIDGYCRLGQISQAFARHDEALSNFERALSLKPDCLDALFGLATLAEARGDTADAVQYFTHVVTISPESAAAHLNLGGIAFREGRLGDAIDHNKKALAAAPSMPQAHNNLGNCHYVLRQYEEAIACYARALELDPALPNAVGLHQLAKRQICDWKNFEATESALLQLVAADYGVVDPFNLLSITDDPALQLKTARQYVSNAVPSVAFLTPLPARRNDGRIRLAYLSPDFHDHPVGILIADLLEKHDRSSFHVSAFSVGPPAEGSRVRGRINQAVDAFIDARATSDIDLARLIRDCDIDLLVDLAGHTHGNRIKALAYRAARVQIAYLGFSGTTGADFLDHILVDGFVAPPAEQIHYTEKLYHLPRCYMVNSRTRPASAVAPSRESCGLPADAFVFCCFNNSFKITPAMFDVWMRLLRDIPGSVLWLKGDSDLSMRNLRDEAKMRGVGHERLIFAANVAYADHLARHGNADLFLDTFPYNAASTASDALWMGLPIVTLAGRSFVARVAGSLLHASGAEDLVAYDIEGYEALARNLACDPFRLAALKQSLLESRLRGPLFDIDSFRDDIERAYTEIWRAHLENSGANQ
jgi:predicted O-linked N-acetylglucosamine transferase (SPINDLY family)